jgi:hypothetical protein
MGFKTVNASVHFIVDAGRQVKFSADSATGASRTILTGFRGMSDITHNHATEPSLVLINSATGRPVQGTSITYPPTVASLYHQLLANGKHEWGPTGSVWDCNLYRDAADRMKSDDTWIFAGIGVGGVPGAAAAVQIDSTTKGFLPPRMDGTQRDAIGSPPDGLILYNTTTSKLQVRAGGAWVDLH